MLNVSSRRILVTGAAAGIGLATSRRLMCAGAVVLMCDKDADGLRAAVSELSGSAGNPQAIVADIADAAAIDRAASEAGVIDGLVNCAGIYPVTPVLELRADEWDRVLTLNLRTPFLQIGRAHV